MLQGEGKPAVERNSALVLPNGGVHREPAGKLFASEERSERRHGFRANPDEPDMAERRRTSDVTQHIECDGIREPIDPIRLI